MATEKKIVLTTTQKTLSYIWFFGSAVPVLILIIQTLLDKYGDATDKIWSWFIPLVFPTITLMISVLGANALKPVARKYVKSNFYTITKVISFIYLFILTMIILFEPFSQKEPIDFFFASSYFLSPLQGIAIASLGFLFTSGAES